MMPCAPERNVPLPVLAILVALTIKTLACEPNPKKLPKAAANRPNAFENVSALSVAIVELLVHVSIGNRRGPELLKKRNPGLPLMGAVLVKKRQFWGSKGRGMPLPLTALTLNGARLTQAVASMAGASSGGEVIGVS